MQREEVIPAKGEQMLSLNSRKAAAAFRAIVDVVGRDTVTAILLDWNDSQLNEDGTKIIRYFGRDREYSRGAFGGKGSVRKADFLIWLMSDAPFDAKVYGPAIVSDSDWAATIGAARKASGLFVGSCP